MDQVSGNVIAMIMEPDVNDSNGYDGTLVQYGVVSYDETTKNFPIYRYEGNDPRTTLVSNAAEQPVEPETPEQPTEPEQPVEPEKPAEPQQPAGSYTVKAGDSLWSIAQKHLGTGTKWEDIYKANQDLLQNPNQIQIGQVLTIRRITTSCQSSKGGVPAGTPPSRSSFGRNQSINTSLRRFDEGRCSFTQVAQQPVPLS